MKPLVEDAVKKYVRDGAHIGDGDGGNDGGEEEEAVPSNYYYSDMELLFKRDDGIS
jgi:hypothetical protein